MMLICFAAWSFHALCLTCAKMQMHFLGGTLFAVTLFQR